MVRRRKRCEADEIVDSLSEVLMQVPVWVGPVLAAGLYLAARFLVPMVFTPEQGTARGAIVGMCQVFAKVGAVLVLVAWIFALFGRFRRGRLLDSQSGVNSLRNMSWQDFELLVGEAYRRQGYLVEERGGGGSDGGVDLVLRQGGEATLVQCKQWKSWKVGVKVVRELYGVMAANQAARGIVVVCGRFTREAREFAKGKTLELVDGRALWKLVKDVQGKAKARPAGQARDGDESTPPEGVQPEAATGPLDCPECGSKMVLRTARRGAHAGSQFYGCSQFPRCNGIRKLEPNIP